MPPNKKGGKNYKKGKHADDEPIVYERLKDQMYGRVLKLLGGCNVLVFCNDEKERICHIRGNMRKKVWIGIGDIVLLSLRDLSDSTPGSLDRGDICARYDQRVIYRLREKDKTINEKLFNTLEKNDGSGQKAGNVPVDNEDGFIFEINENEESDNSNLEIDEDVLPVNRLAQRQTINYDDNDFDVDDI
jgi:translation initiation factor 1A